MVVHGKSVDMAEINFLCVHKKLRDNRLAPMLIKEVTRRINLENVWQAIYTTGVTLPTPFMGANYWHRNINCSKLIECRFSFKPANQTIAAFNKLHRLPDKTETLGLREMVVKDIPAVTWLFNQH